MEIIKRKNPSHSLDYFEVPACQLKNSLAGEGLSPQQAQNKYIKWYNYVNALSTEK